MPKSWQPERTATNRQEKLSELLQVRVSRTFMTDLKEFAKREDFDYSVSEAVRVGLATIMDHGSDLIEGWHNTHWVTTLRHEAKQVMKDRERALIASLYEEWKNADNPIDRINCEADAKDLLEHCYLEASRETLRKILAA